MSLFMCLAYGILPHTHTSICLIKPENLVQTKNTPFTHSFCVCGGAPKYLSLIFVMSKGNPRTENRQLLRIIID